MRILIGGLGLMIAIGLPLCFFIESLKATKEGRGAQYVDSGPYHRDYTHKTNMFGYGFLLLIWIIGGIMMFFK